jgi:hypothetical protein
MKVKNNFTNPIAIGGTVIPAGSTVDVADWEDRKDSYAVKKMIEGGALSPASSGSTEASPELRVSTMQELDRLKVDYPKAGKGSKTEDLVALLDEQKKKLAADGKLPT